MKLGVLFLGVNGAVATTVTSGVAAVTRGLCDPIGMLTFSPELEGLDLIPLESLTFGGWDMDAGCHFEKTKEKGIVPEPLLAKLGPDLCDVAVWQAPNMKSGAPGHMRQTVDGLVSSILKFRQMNGLSGTVVVNTMPTQPPVRDCEAYHDLERFEAALDRDDPRLNTGMIYAYAAIRSESPFINFTPNVASDIPALEEMARKYGVVLAGKDGKTGQTLYKTALAPMFRDRRLRIDGWYSTNLLGNGDGLTLSDPDAVQSKITSKAEVLPRIMGYDNIAHQVHIHYYPPRADRKEAWDSIDFTGWLGIPMSMKINWLGQDSPLAAALIADLIRMVWFAQQRGESGVAVHLAHFFKSPIGTSVTDFFQQMQMFRQYCDAALAGRAEESVLALR